VELAAIIEEATSNVRHSLRNKLGSIRNAAFYVKRQLSQTDAWSADPRLELMASIVESDVAAANDLLGLADGRLHARCPMSIDVKSCVLEAVRHARVGPGIGIDVELPSATVFADPAELAVAFRCLIENAAEAMGNGGLVKVRAVIDADWYRLDVIGQTGLIPKEARDAMLGAFYTTKRGHIGLGLNIALRVALRNGGKLLIDGLATVGTASMILRTTGENRNADGSTG
jgi:signal transduction histidine kinase